MLSTFNEDRVEIARRDGTLTTTLEVLVSAEDDAEVRRVSISNAGRRARDIEITSYAELVSGPQSADVAHPAFAKMFVETEYLAEFGAILATRRKRAPTEPEIWAAHLSVANGEVVGGPAIRNRQGAVPRPRAQCSGANRDAGRAAVWPIRSAPCSIRSSRCAVVSASPPGATVRVAFWTMAAGTRAALLGLHRQTSGRRRPMSAQRRWPGPRRRCNCTISASSPAKPNLFQRLAGHVIFAAPRFAPLVGCHPAGLRSAIWSVVAGHIGRSANRAAANCGDRKSQRRPPGVASA